MKIYLSREPKDLANAKAWIANTATALALDRLLHTLSSLEATWGQCAILLESTIPPTGKFPPAQIDLLVAFSDRTALIEIKQGLGKNAGQLNVELSAFRNQVERSFLTIRAYIRKAEINDPVAAPIIWAPHIDRDGLRSVRQLLKDAGAVHISAVSGRPSLAGTSLDGQPAFLPEHVMWRLERVAPLGIGPSHHLGEYFTGILNGEQIRLYGAPAYEFIDFDAVRDYLNDEVVFHSSARLHDATHVSRLRPIQLNNALKVLARQHLVEITAPQGSGKSWFIKELANALLGSLARHHDLHERVLRNSKSLNDILLTFANAVGLEEAGQLHTDTLLRALADREAIYWIVDYSRNSRPAVTMLIDGLRCIYSGDENLPRQAFWIVESMVPKLPEKSEAETYQIVLEPLDDSAIARILSRHSPGSISRDINSVLVEAAGNPLRAIHLWKRDGSEPLPAPERLDRYEIFADTLRSEERPFILPIAYILEAAPLGATLRLVETWCRAARPTVVNAQEAVHNVLEKARNQGLITVEMFGARELGIEGTINAIKALAGAGEEDDLVGSILPVTVRNALIGWIRIADPHFADHFLAKITPERKPEWRELLHDVLYSELGDNYSLTGVTLSLLIEDYEPFVRSSFRSSSAIVPQLVSWLAVHDNPYEMTVGNLDPAYFRDWLKWLKNNYYDMPVSQTPGRSWDTDLVTRGPQSSLQRLLLDNVNARGVPYWNGEVHDWARWSEAAADFWSRGEYDLWAEALLRQAQAMLRPPYSQPTRAWQLFKAVMKEESKLSVGAGRPMLYFHVLSFLNKRKLWNDVQAEAADDPSSLVPALSIKMLQANLISENLATAANALFMLGRWFELVNRPKTAAQVETYVALMRFAQRVSPARRIPALLTEGSIYRHYTSQSDLPWEEFRDYSEKAFDAYLRVLDSSLPGSLVTYAADALSYTGELLLRGLRYSPAPEMWRWLHNNLLWARGETDYFLGILEQDTAKTFPALGKNIAINLYRHLALQTLLVCLLFDPERIPDLEVDFSAAVASLRDLSVAFSRHQRLRTYSEAIDQLARTFGFINGLRIESVRRRSIMTACKASLDQFFAEVIKGLPTDARALSRSDVRKDANKLLGAFVSAGYDAPTHFGEALAAPRVA